LVDDAKHVEDVAYDLVIIDEAKSLFVHTFPPTPKGIQ
jgi:hypothetical protein